MVVKEAEGWRLQVADGVVMVMVMMVLVVLARTGSIVAGEDEGHGHRAVVTDALGRIDTTRLCG